MTDADRERAVRALTRHCGDGRLTLNELEERIAQVYAATTAVELSLAFRDLPATTSPRSTRTGPAPIRLGEPGLRPLINAAWAAWEARQASASSR